MYMLVCPSPTLFISVITLGEVRRCQKDLSGANLQGEPRTMLKCFVQVIS